MTACTNPCPGECPEVFDRIIVSHIVRGPTRVSWELLPTFTDPNPLLFQLQVGSSNNPDADDWEDVGLPVENQYYALDDEQRVWGMTNFTHYRVKVTSPLGEYTSPPMSGQGILDKRGWLHAREIVRQRRLAFRVGPGGQRGYLLKRRWTGEPCPLCTDPLTEEVRDPDCPNCFGTGKRCGYYYPVGCVWAELSPKSHHTEIVDGRGTVDDVVVKATMLAVDMLGEEDVWIAAATDDRYYVHRVTHTAEYRGVPVIADVELRLAPFSSIIYTIEVPQQLAEQEEG